MKEMQEKYFHERSFHERAFRFIREHKMLLPGERVAAGISGGADSVCLLFVLLEWKRRYGLELAAVHVNHGIRDRAGEDARFVEELCRRLEIP
ncbi:MAG: tRNA(Ile)-lysidine synthetase, partial [Acetatifactor sp.]|nr:tRNA(Ile)-lysidine synthetase [Acetatifactor sp.]